MSLKIIVMRLQVSLTYFLGQALLPQLFMADVSLQMIFFIATTFVTLHGLAVKILTKRKLVSLYIITTAYTLTMITT